MNEELKIIIEADVTNLQGGVKKAEESINGLGNAANKAKQPIANANYALSNLGRVASDAPFGFIAIQNNLTPLIDSFQSLKVQSGSVGGAIKALGSSLIGVGGLGFAFAAIPALITALIQQYGSLSSALTALTSKNKAAAESQILFNKEISKGQDSVGAELGQIDILVKQLTNLKEPLAARQAAYEQLKKVQPDILLGISKENVLTGNATSLIIANASARKQMILLKVRENAINEVLNKNGGELLRLENKRNKAINDEAAQTALLNKTKLETPKAFDTIKRQQTLLTQLSAATITARAEFDKLQAVQDSYLKLLEPIVLKTAEQTKKTIDLKTAEQEDAEAKKQQANAAEQLAKKNEKLALSTAKQNAKLDEGFKIAKEAAAKAGAIQGPVENPRDLKPLGEVQSFQGSVIAENLLKEAEAAALARVEYEKYAVAVSSLVAPAIDQLFTSFENGKNIFQALSETIKSLVIDIAKAIVKATILKGITSFIEKGGGAGFFGGLFNLLGGSLGGVSAPTFGGGAGLGGGLALNGEVIFVQRGTDLVGVLNRGNSQINRVG